MRRILATLAVVVALLFSAGAAWADSDFDLETARPVTPEDVREPAEQGDAFFQFMLGFMYGNGQGVQQDYAEAVKWYRLAAEQGDADAQYNLGLMYRKGQGVPQDDAEAVKWYRLAAAQGYADAQFNLGAMYFDGRGVPQDDAEAVKWYRLAAAQGYAEAQVNLGVMYEHGVGVPQDYAEAVKWYRLAADQGNADARSKLDHAIAQIERQKKQEEKRVRGIAVITGGIAAILGVIITIVIRRRRIANWWWRRSLGFRAWLISSIFWIGGTFLYVMTDRWQEFDGETLAFMFIPPIVLRMAWFSYRRLIVGKHQGRSK